MNTIMLGAYYEASRSSSSSGCQVTFGVRQDAFLQRFRLTKDVWIETLHALYQLIVLLLLLHI